MSDMIGSKQTLLRLHPFICWLAIAGASACFAQTPSAGSSLKNKTDQELVDLIRGEDRPIDQKFAEENAESRVKFSSLDRLWEMAPSEAAIALVTDHLSRESKDATFKIDDPHASPPKAGEIGLRWISGNEYAPRQHGLTILKNDGWKSRLLLSQIEIVGRSSKKEMEAAIMKTDSHPIPRLVAKQTYEILWWLRHVKIDHHPEVWSGGVVSSGDDFGNLWMKPDGPDLKRVIFSEPSSLSIDGNYDIALPTFAATVIRRLIQRSGIKDRYPIPKIGHFIDNDPDSVFLRWESPPLPGDHDAQKKWVGRLIDILHKPDRDFLYWEVMDLLVPISDPLRYDDPRINEGLLDVMHRCAQAAKKIPAPQPEAQLTLDSFVDEEAEKKARIERNKRREQERALERRRSDLQSASYTAAMKLGLHDAVSAFAEILDAAPVQAAAIVARHPGFKPQFVEFLRRRTPDPNEAEPPSGTVEAIWRADLHEFAPWLKKLATSQKDGATADQWIGPRHEAKIVLLAWNESDDLTKTKLDILLTGILGGSGSIPEVLKSEFSRLSLQDQATIRGFVSWMRTADVSFSRRYIENYFTPHTPRPDIPFER